MFHEFITNDLLLFSQRRNDFRPFFFHVFQEISLEIGLMDYKS